IRRSRRPRIRAYAGLRSRCPIPIPAGSEFMRGKRPRNCGVPVAWTTTAPSLPPQGDADLATSQRNHFIPQFVVRERVDGSFLIACKLIRESTGLKMKADGPVCIIDAVRAEVRNRTADQRLGFLRGRGRWSVGRDFRKVGTRKHEKKTVLRVEHNDALRIGAVRLDLAAIREHVLPRGERPRSNKLIP